MASSSMKAFLKSREKFVYYSKTYEPIVVDGMIVAYNQTSYAPYEKMETTVKREAKRLCNQTGADFNDVYQEMLTIATDIYNKEMQKKEGVSYEHAEA